MNLPRLPTLTSVAIAGAALAIAVAGCSSGAADSEAHRSSRDGLTVTNPPGWQTVRLAGLPGADVPLEAASFRVRGAVRTICDPHRIVDQIPAGGALVQILRDSGVKRRGAGAVSQVSPEQLNRYPTLHKPFHLGRLQSYECGEAYSVFFRIGGRVFQLRVWSAPAGPSAVVRRQIEQLMDSLNVDRRATTTNMTYRNSQASVEATIPADWQAIHRSINGVLYPPQVLAAASFRVRVPRQPTKSCHPGGVLRQMPADGVLLQIFEYTPGDPRLVKPARVPHLPHRPQRFLYSTAAYGPFECAGLSYKFDFEEKGRAFQAQVWFNRKTVDPRFRAEALQILDGFHPLARSVASPAG